MSRFQGSDPEPRQVLHSEQEGKAKIVFKEDWIPPFADKAVFVVAPAIIMLTSLLAFAVILTMSKRLERRCHERLGWDKSHLLTNHGAFRQPPSEPAWKKIFKYM